MGGAAHAMARLARVSGTAAGRGAGFASLFARAARVPRAADFARRFSEGLPG